MVVSKELQNKNNRRRNNGIIFSATLPDDACDIFAGSICAVMYSEHPISDVRESILEIIQFIEIHDWDGIEELVNFYIALNSPEVHHQGRSQEF
ncbi:hypothetical protein SLA2020_228190 [Shorea laevis]